jgi:pyruvate kinase
MTRGLLPILATPQPHGDTVLEEAVAVASRMGIVKPHDHVVAVQRIHDDFCVKIVSVDALGAGIKRINLVTGEEREGVYMGRRGVGGAGEGV